MAPGLAFSAAVAVLPASWGRWPDVLIDFGHQLYTAWRLSEGGVLGRDVATLHGPLSPYVNAALFRVFGVSLRALVVFNLALAALALWLLQALFARLSGRLSAAVCGLFFVLVFAFSQPIPYGNYNWVAPYVHEVTHGALLALAGLLALASWEESGKPAILAAAGLLLGLTFLTKAETFAGAAVGDAVFLGSLLGGIAESRARSLALFGGAALLAPAAAFGLLATALPAREAFLATLGPFRPDVLLGGAARNVFFTDLMGITHPMRSLARIALVGAVYAAFLVPAWLVARTTPPRRERLAAAGTAAVGVLALALLAPRIPWLACALPFPFLVLALAASTARRLAGAVSAEEAARERLRLALSALALTFSAKIGLACVLHHYGFVLAMPAALLLADAALEVVPRGLPSPWVFRSAALTALAAISAAFLSLSRAQYAAKTVQVGGGADAFLADGRGVFVNAALLEIDKAAPPAGTLAAVPEGAMLSYLARRRNPTSYTNLMPPEVLTFGDARIAAAFRARPPDIVAVVHKSTAEWGLPYFGRDYGREIAEVVNALYAPVALVGAPPLRDERFGIAILRRKR
jgi:hypothetical protein